MISFEQFTLANGLQVIVHEDPATTMAVVDVIYNVGSRDEDENLTGFAHLFEHLMFGGSVNIPSFDTPLQKASGENNAFTSNDITNYYITLPAENIETALWLESDRMLRLDFSEKSLAVQKGVVIEEFKQRYLNQPYGDAWLELRPLAYQKHPYQWATIGKEISHIENAELSDVIAFFERFYNPSNATLCIAGNISLESAYELCEKWFGDIPVGPVNQNLYEQEPEPVSRREKLIQAEVPQEAIYLAFQMVERKHELYYAFDLLSDILSGTDSSRFINILVKEKAIFTHVHAYISGEIDKGLFIIEGKLNEGISYEKAEASIFEVLKDVAEQGIPETELQKVKNKAITSNLFAKTSVLNKAMSLCYAYRLGNPDLINTETELMKSITTEQIRLVCQNYLMIKKHNVLKYQSK